MSSRWDRTLALALLCVISQGMVVAAQEGASQEKDLADLKQRILSNIEILDVPQLRGKIKVDGIFDEPFWTNAAAIELKFETYPAQFETAPVRTETWALRVNDDLVFGFRAYDPDPQKIQAPFRDRDGIELDDYVGFSFDPEGKKLRTYEFYVSARGVQADWVRNQVDGTRSRDWDADWEAAALIGTNGYTAEMRVPLSEMDIPVEKGLKRIVVFKRHYPREVRHHLSAFAMTESDPDQTPEVKRTFKIVPSISYVMDRTRDPVSGTDWETDDEFQVSLDMEYKFTTTLGLYATLNPNYLEVEADLTETSINDPFTTLVPEKRPFFTKGIETFGTPFDLVYTRNIVDPRFGLKFGGSVWDVTMGNFFADDRELSLIVPGNLSSKRKTLDDTESYSGAFRYRYDFKEGMSVGLISTIRAGAGYHNAVAGADFYAKLGLKHELRAQWIFSDSAYPQELYEALLTDVSSNYVASADIGLPGETRFNEQVLRADPDYEYRDDALQLAYKYSQRGGYVSAKYRDVGEDFRADLGYMPRVDYRMGSVSGGLDHYFETRKKGVSRIRLSGTLLRQESQAGEMLIESRDVWLNYWGLLQSWVRIGYRDRDRIARRFLQNTLEIDGNAPEFNEDQYMIRAESSLLKDVRLILAGRFGTQIDTDNYRLGDILELEPELRCTVTDHFEVSLKNTYRHLDVEGGRLFTENFLTLNLTYQIKKGTFVRLTMIDDYLKRDPALYLYEEVDALERDTSAELLFAWKPTHRNVFFIGLKTNVKDATELERPRWDETLFYVKYARSFSL
jgi:Domain of unknown function (DUF5916)